MKSWLHWNISWPAVVRTKSLIYAFQPALFQVSQEDKCTKASPASGDVLTCYSAGMCRVWDQKWLWRSRQELSSWRWLIVTAALGQTPARTAAAFRAAGVGTGSWKGMVHPALGRGGSAFPCLHLPEVKEAVAVMAGSWCEHECCRLALFCRLSYGRWR